MFMKTNNICQLKCENNDFKVKIYQNFFTLLKRFKKVLRFSTLKKVSYIKKLQFSNFYQHFSNDIC